MVCWVTLMSFSVHFFTGLRTCEDPDGSAAILALRLADLSTRSMKSGQVMSVWIQVCIMHTLCTIDINFGYLVAVVIWVLVIEYKWFCACFLFKIKNKIIFFYLAARIPIVAMAYIFHCCLLLHSRHFRWQTCSLPVRWRKPECLMGKPPTFGKLLMNFAMCSLQIYTILVEKSVYSQHETTQKSVYKWRRLLPWVNAPQAIEEVVYTNSVTRTGLELTSPVSQRPTPH